VTFVRPIRHSRRTFGLVAAIPVALLLIGCDGSPFGNRNPLIGKWELANGVNPALGGLPLAARFQFTESSLLVGPFALPVTYEISGDTVVVRGDFAVGIAFQMEGRNSCHVDVVNGVRFKFTRSQSSS